MMIDDWFKQGIKIDVLFVIIINSSIFKPIYGAKYISYNFELLVIVSKSQKQQNKQIIIKITYKKNKKSFFFFKKKNYLSIYKYSIYINVCDYI